MDAYQRKGPRAPLGGDPAKARLQKLQRALAFVGELVATLRAEFVPYRSAVGRMAQATSPVGEASAPTSTVHRFLQKLDLMARQLERGREVEAKALEAPPLEASRHLGAFELQLEALTAAARGLEAEAGEARQALGHLGGLERDARPAVRGTSPLGRQEAADREHARMAGPEQRGTGLLQAIRRLAASATAPLPELKQGPPKPPPAPDPNAKARQAFEAALRFVEEVLAYVSPRLLLVDTGMALTGLPGPARPWGEVMREAPMAVVKAKIPPSDRNWVPSLAKLFLNHPDAMRRAHGALVQWANAKLQAAEGKALQAQLAEASSVELSAALLRKANTPRLQASAFPLSHLHLSFQGLPQLSALFPPPSGGAKLGPPGGALGGGKLGTA